MSNEQTRPNFFLLLDLDPAAAWSDSKFEEALKKKRVKWSLDASGVAKTALAASKNMRLIPEIRRIMLDPMLRKTEAQAAKAEQTSGKRARIGKFEAEILLAQKKGYLEDAEFASYVKEYKDVLSEQEIRKHIQVEIRSLTANKEQSAQTLDPSIMDSITDNLRHLKVADLYALLEMKSTTSNKELSEAATHLAADMRDKQPKDDNVTARGFLAGHAKNIFSSDIMRKKYDESVRQSSLKTLFENLDTIVNRTTTKELHPDQAAKFIEDARKIGFSPEEAMARLKERTSQRRWSLIVPANVMEQKQRCGKCNELNTMNRTYCSACGENLTLPCPQCGKNTASDEVRCDACGFPVGNRYHVDDLLAQIDALLKQPAPVQEIQELLTVAEKAWQPATTGAWTPKTSDRRNELLKKYKKYISIVIEQKQEQITQLRQMIDRKEFFSAQKLLVRLEGEKDVDVARYKATIEAKINEATSLIKRTQSTSVTDAERFEICRRVLQNCSDYQSARDLLGTLSLAPPTNVQARASELLVSLTWDPSTMRDVRYKVVRKQGARPVSVNDGVVLATVTACLYDDKKPEIGVPLFYAIFTECEGVTSTKWGTLPRPILITRDITNEVQRSYDRQITLSWDAPPNVHTVVVVRKERVAPRDQNDGTPIRLLSTTSLTDRLVQNEIPYFYTVWCQFQNAEGQLVTSAGKTIRAQAEAPPEMITELIATNTRSGQAYNVHLRWKPPARAARVVIVRAAQAPSWNVGDVLPVAQLGKHGQVLEGQRDSLNDTWSASGVAYYIPVIISNTTAHIGKVQRHVWMDEVRDLRVQPLGSSLRLLWTWPENCQEVEAAYSYQGWPQPEEKQRYKTVTLAEYEHYGHYDITGVENQDCYVVVRCVFRNGHERITTSGTKKQARLVSETKLAYQIKKPTLLRRHHVLSVHIDTPGSLSVLPAFVLITRRNGLPQHKNDGNILLKIPAGLAANQKDHVIALPERTFPVNTVAKLFVDDESLEDVIRIFHNQEYMRLS